MAIGSLGNSDRPVANYSDDEFQIRPYIEGLAEFIKDCETPMTVAVQGDWGCGKTSMMNMVRNYLNPEDGNENIVDVWFNTWQFSQFNMDQTLSVTFLQHLMNELTHSLNHSGEVMGAVFSRTKNVLKAITKGLISTAIGEAAGEVMSELNGDGSDETCTDAATQILELKKAFHDLIAKVGKRVVVYIDDLDRLQPVRAIELLEILKLFVDCENCVFVMAIDTSVVFQGIREKYGRDMSEAKAQSFFDKMIQLPFRMPVAYYKLDSMIERLLTFLQGNEIISDKYERQELINLLKCTSDGNPRSLKRLVNSVMLLDKVAIKKGLYSVQASAEKQYKMKILVSLSCLQHRFNTYYDFIVENISPMSVNKLSKVEIPLKTKNDHCDQLLENLYGIGMPQFSDAENKNSFFELMIYFLNSIKKYITHRRDLSIDDKDINYELVQIISLNNITESDDFRVPEEHTAESPNAGETSPDGDDRELPERIRQITQNYESIRDKTDEIIPLLEENGIYAGLQVKGYNGSEKPSALYEKLDSQLRKWLRAESNDSFGGLVYSNYYIEEAKYLFGIRLVYTPHDRTINAEINIGTSSAPLYAMPAAERVYSFVKFLRQEHKRLYDLFDGKLISENFDREIDEVVDDKGNTSYNNDRFSFAVLSDSMANELLNFAVAIATDPSLLKVNEQYQPNAVKLNTL